MACAPIEYADAVAEARVRTIKGWHRIHLEASGQHLRLEYASTRSPTGRVAVVGIADSTEVYWFPVGPNLYGGHLARRTSWEAVHRAVGLPSPRTLWDRYAADWAPIQQWGSYRCRSAIGDWSYDGTYDKTVCIAVARGADNRQGLPLYVTDSTGSSLFEVTRLEHRTVPASRFSPPPGPGQMAVNLSCGGAKRPR